MTKLSKSGKKIDERVAVLEAQRGDFTKLAILFSGSFKIRLHKKLFQLFGTDTERIADATADVWIKMQKNISSFDPERGKLFTWAGTILNNLAIDEYRKKRKENMTTNTFSSYENRQSNAHINVACSSAEMKTSRTENTDIYSVLLEKVHELDWKSRKLIELRYMQDVSYEDMAEQLSLPLGSVKGQINKAKHLLKIKLEATGINRASLGIFPTPQNKK